MAQALPGRLAACLEAVDLPQPALQLVPTPAVLVHNPLTRSVVLEPPVGSDGRKQFTGSYEQKRDAIMF